MLATEAQAAMQSPIRRKPVPERSNSSENSATDFPLNGETSAPLLQADDPQIEPIDEASITTPPPQRFSKEKPTNDPKYPKPASRTRKSCMLIAAELWLWEFAFFFVAFASL